MLSAKKIMTIEDIEKELFKKFKMNGLVLGEENAIKMMDLNLDLGTTSNIIPAKINKDGSFAKHSKIASKQEFEGISNYLHHLYVKTGNAITEGNVAISPYKLKDRTPCTFCAYKSVCQFDESMEENQFRLLVPKSKEQALDLMKKEVYEDDDQ
jgi:ATP-dependent helicase/nuclease subunit B